MPRTIVCDERLDGRPRLSDTLIEVCDVVEHMNNGAKLKDLVQLYPYITIGDIQLIKVYYKRHAGKIDQLIKEREKCM